MQHSNRREFLKKAAYVAPAMIALGALSTPAKAQSSAIFTGSNGNQFTSQPNGTGTTVTQDGNTIVIPSTDDNLGDFADWLNS